MTAKENKSCCIELFKIAKKVTVIQMNPDLRFMQRVIGRWKRSIEGELSENLNVGSLDLVSFKGNKSMIFDVGQITVIDQKLQPMFLKQFD